MFLKSHLALIWVLVFYYSENRKKLKFQVNHKWQYFSEDSLSENG